MYEWDDILIVGDSWCSERDKLVYWPNQLLFELTEIAKGIPRGRGFSGCAWWSIRNELFKELNKKLAKVVIIIHTDSSRIPNDMDKPFTIQGAEKYANLKCHHNRIIYKAAYDYYRHLYSANFHNWAEKQWFLELDSFLEKKQIEKVIHFYGVARNNDQKYIFKHGITIKHALEQYLQMNTTNISYPNHMTYEKNQKLAWFLFELITNYPGHGFVHEEKNFLK